MALECDRVCPFRARTPSDFAPSCRLIRREPKLAPMGDCPGLLLRHWPVLAGQNRGPPAAGSVKSTGIHFGQPPATAAPVPRGFANGASIFLTGPLGRSPTGLLPRHAPLLVAPTGHRHACTARAVPRWALASAPGTSRRGLCEVHPFIRPAPIPATVLREA